MRDRTNGVQAVTQDLLNTGMHGIIRPGDTIGIWTYSSQLHADEAPLQIWNSKTAAAIAYNTVLFLQQHAFERSAAFNDVLTNMLRVVKISDTVTIILISDGTDTIKGTPFDAQLTTFYKTNYHAQKKTHMPIVTVFRGEKGVITTNTLALTPYPVDIPAVPPMPVVKAAEQKPAPVVEPVAPPKPVPSLVIIGKKAETTFNVPTDLPDHSGEPPAQPAVATPPAETTPVVAKTETVSTPEPAPAPKIEEKPKPVVATPSPAPSVAGEPIKTVLARELSVPYAPSTNAPSETVAPATSAPTQAAAVTPEKNLFSGRNIGIVSVVFTLLVCTLLILSARNARRTARASLITRSLDRENR